MKQQYDALLGAPVMSIVCTSLLTSSILPAPTRHYPAGLPWPQKWNRKSSVQLPLPLHSANKSIFTLLESRLADKFPPDNFPPGGTCPKWNLSGGNLSGGKLSGGNLSFLDACLPGELVRGELVQNGTCPQGHLSGGNLSGGKLSGGNLSASHFFILLSVRGCQYGVIHSLERFFLWFVTLVLKTSNTLNRFSNQLKSDLEMTLRYLTLYLMCRYGELVASHPVKAIIGCFIVTALGGAGLFR